MDPAVAREERAREDRNARRPRVLRAERRVQRPAFRARLAGAARLSLNVIVVDVTREDKMVGGAASPPPCSSMVMTQGFMRTP